MIEFILIAFVCAFILQFLDASAGMGYGTLTAILILLGFSPLESISSVIVTSSVLSLFAGIMHHNFKNANLLEKQNKKILSILIGFGIIAIIFGSLIALNIPSNYLKIYIGFLIIIIGIFILIKKKTKYKFSWKRLMFFGSLASFNKGISGEGYGPVLAGGQILSGVKSKKAVAITSLSEGVVSLIGFISFLIFGSFTNINFSLILSLLAGGLISTPLAVYFVKSIKSKKLKYFIAGISIISGILILIKLFS